MLIIKQKELITMRGKHIKIELTKAERTELEKHAKTGKRSVKLVNRAKIILELDEGGGRKPLTQEAIAEKLGVSRKTVNVAKKAFLAASSAVAAAASAGAAGAGADVGAGAAPADPDGNSAAQAAPDAFACASPGTGVTASFLRRKKRETPPVAPKITGEIEARIIAMACGAAPEGCARWSLRLIAEKCVELNYIDSISFKSVQRVLKKRSSSRT